MQAAKRTGYVTTLVANPNELTPEAIKAAKEALKAAGHLIIRGNELARGEAYDIYTLGDSLPSFELKDAGNNPLKVDVLPQTLERRNTAKKMLISDMDSTMLQQECINELATAYDPVIGAQVSGMTSSTMGDADSGSRFKASLRARLALMEGLPYSILDGVVRSITPMPGAKELLSTLKRRKDFKAAILVSGGFTEFTEHAAKILGFDEDYAGTLQWDAEDKLSKEIDEPIYDSDGKCRVLHERSAAHGVDLSEVIALGDGSNDIGMLNAVHNAGGLAIAYHAESDVQRAGDFLCINHATWRGALFAMGFELERGEFVSGGRARVA